MKTILGVILTVLTGSVVWAGGLNSGAQVPYPTEWSQPRVLANGTVVPAVPIRFETQLTGVQFQPGMMLGAAAPGSAAMSDTDNALPLIAAADRGDLKAVQALIKNKANVNQVNFNGATALMAASAGGHLDVVKFLLDSHAQVNDVSKAGKTALSYAAQRGQLKVVQLLMQSKADPNVMDEAGKLAVDYATDGHFTNVVAVLKGEKPGKTPATK